VYSRNSVFRIGCSADLHKFRPTFLSPETTRIPQTAQQNEPFCLNQVSRTLQRDYKIQHSRIGLHALPQLDTIYIFLSRNKSLNLRSFIVLLRSYVCHRLLYIMSVDLTELMLQFQASLVPVAPPIIPAVEPVEPAENKRKKPKIHQCMICNKVLSRK